MAYKYTVRNDAGDTFEVDESKIHLAEKDGFRTVVSNGSEEHRVSFDKLNQALKDGYKPMRKSDVNMVESGLRGLAQGASFGFADEITGAAEALFTDKTYQQARDESRRAYSEAQEANPVTYGASEIGAGIATAFVPGLGALNAGRGARLAEVAGKAALQGGLYGAGSSEADNAADVAKDALKGAAVGGALGAAAHGVSKVLPKIPEAYNSISSKAKEAGPKLDHAVDAFKEGAKEVRPSILDFVIPGYSQAKQLGIGGVNVIKEMKRLGVTEKEIESVADSLRTTFGPGAFNNLSKEEVLMRGLLDEGDNAAKRFVADKFGAIGGDSDTYLKLLQHSPEETLAARQFDRTKAADELTEGLSSTYNEFKNQAGAKFDELKNAARSNFTDQGTEPVRIVGNAIQDAGKYRSISGTTRNVLNDVFDDLTGREGEKTFTQLTPPEQFDRIHAARQRLGDAVKWATQNEPAEGQRILKETYDKFGSVLKKLDEMAEADKGYSQFKRVEKNLFKKLGNVERGNIQDFDSTKIETLLGGTKTSRKLAKELSRVKKMLDDGTLSPEAAEKVKPFFDKLEDALQKSNLNREITKFRYNDAGPSSPAIQRLQASLGKDSATATAAKSPQLFLQIRENAVRNAEPMFGKPFRELNLRQKEAVGKYAIWKAANPNATDTEMKWKFVELVNQATKEVP